MGRTIDDATWEFAQARLREDWSPEQISNHAAISIETVYQRVYADKRAGGLLWRTCAARSSAGSVTASMTGAASSPTGNPSRRAIVEERSRIGDWEADTIIGKNHKQAIVSLVERKSGFTLIRKVERKTARAVRKAAVSLLKPHRDKVHTLTSDNGKEFSEHEQIAKAIGADFYFAHPYASWERGTNENTNGLIRQYFPKNRDFTTITQQEINHAMKRLNNRPRKRPDS